MKLPELNIPWWGKVIVVVFAISGTVGEHLTAAFVKLAKYNQEQIQKAKTEVKTELITEMDRRTNLRNEQIISERKIVSAELTGLKNLVVSLDNKVDKLLVIKKSEADPREFNSREMVLNTHGGQSGIRR